MVGVSLRLLNIATENTTPHLTSDSPRATHAEAPILPAAVCSLHAPRRDTRTLLAPANNEA